MRVAIFGASGMVGGGALLECLDDSPWGRRIDSVLVIGRTPTGVRHPKLEEILHSDFFDYSSAPLRSRLAGLDACFFCLGVTSAGKSEAEYTRLTYDLTLAAARAILAESPGAVFVYVSGAGTDSTERGRVMWARVKGRTENALLALPFRAAYMMRPGFIQPMRGLRSKTPLYRAFYAVLAPLFPLARKLFPRQVVTTVEVGRAMIRLAGEGVQDARKILDPADIRRLAAT
jgi:uncharacterized protein YbjT (DUF2867 family)